MKFLIFKRPHFHRKIVNLLQQFCYAFAKSDFKCRLSQSLKHKTPRRKNIFNQSELILSYYTHLLVTLIDSKFFDELCDVCIGRHLDDNFMVEENVNVSDNSAIPQTQNKTMRRQSFSIKDAINGPKRSTLIEHRITDDLDTEKEDGIVEKIVDFVVNLQNKSKS